MNIIKYFFRVNKDSVRFEAYSLTHLILLVFMLGVSVLFFLNQETIRKNKTLDNIIRGLLMFLILFQQGTFLYFNFILRGNGLALGLPLFTCRAALYTSFLALITSWKTPRSVTVYWGFVGGIIPMLFPDLEYYVWPHISVLNYFLTHFLVFWTASYILFVKEFKFTKKDFSLNFVFTNIFLSVSLLANVFLGGNYAYLTTSPLFKDIFLAWPRPLYILLVYLIYNAFYIIVHIIGLKSLQKARSKKVDLIRFYKQI